MRKLLFVFLICPYFLFSQDVVPNEPEVPLERFKVMKVTKKDSIRIIDAWDLLSKLLEKNDQRGFSAASLEKVDCSKCSNFMPNIVSVDSFVLFYRTLLSQEWFATMINTKRFNVSRTKYPDGLDGSYSQLMGQKNISKVLYIYRRKLPEGIVNREYYSFLFVKVNDMYKFLGMSISR